MIFITKLKCWISLRFKYVCKIKKVLVVNKTNTGSAGGPVLQSGLYE